MLTHMDIEQFRTNGYLAIRQAISPKLLEELRATTDAFVAQSRNHTVTNDVFDLEPDHSAQNPRLRRLKDPVKQSPIYWQTATSDAVLGCVKSLIGPNIKFHHSKLNMKTEKGGAMVGWHQDYAFFPHTNFDLVACGIALDDCTLENGCLLVVPGTHRIGVLSHRSSNGEFVGSISPGTDSFDASKAVPVELRAGDMSIHHACVVHGSSQNNSVKQRRLLIFQYAAADAIALDRTPLTNEYSERVISGEPALFARLEGAISIPLRGNPRGARSIFESQRATTMM